MLSLKFALMFTQLRDVLAAEESAIVAKKDNHGRMLLPKGAESNLVACSLGQDHVSESFTVGLRHSR